jgi:hypothetical protein
MPELCRQVRTYQRTWRGPHPAPVYVYRRPTRRWLTRVIRAAASRSWRPLSAVLFWLALAAWAAFVLGSTWVLTASGRPGLWPAPTP